MLGYHLELQKLKNDDKMESTAFYLSFTATQKCIVTNFPLLKEKSASSFEPADLFSEDTMTFNPKPFEK